MSTMVHKEEIPQGLPFLGNAMLFLGLGILALSLTGTEWLPFNMPRSWYQNPTVWKLLALCMTGGGIAVLKQVSSSEMKNELRNRETHQSEDWMPEEHGQRFETLTVYTKKNCPLCEEASEILEDYAAYLPQAELIDIYSDPALVEKFGTCVPVVVIDGKIRFRGRINEVLLRRLIVASPAKVVSQKSCGCNNQGCGCKRPQTESESSGCGGNCRCA
ncbi:glutaredoxin family protein [uncultured Gimesia sp.]|jgi:glutaredoxin|uniref:glutaredoxin family protein n=1 Tax=uncultured Gimesia sp. TaxID=1678688 RepID=UPI00262A0C3E|nr:glutaredoxin family protein [uncultured Gimesia sp.]